jgi:hypothetical protein
MESWPKGPYFSVESYERAETGRGYKAVLVDPNTGALVTLEKDR